MITIQKRINITGGVTPYTFTFSSSSPCISFPFSSITGDILTLTIQGAEECLQLNPTITINGFDANGCSFEETFGVSNPCTDFLVSPITNSDLTFYISASTACGELDFNWNLPEDFVIVSQIDNQYTSQVTIRTATIIENLVPVNYTISCDVVSTCNGCVRSEQKEFILCRPLITNIFAEAYCISSGVWETCLYTIPNTEDCGALDFTSLNFATPTQVQAIVIGNRVKFRITTRFVSNLQYTFNYVVNSLQGVTSNVASVTININVCTVQTVYAPPSTTRVSSGAVPTDVILTNLSSRVVSANPIDWSSFTVLPNIPYTSPSITLQTAVNGDQNIRYVVPAVPITESFQFTIADTLGNTSDAITETYVFQTDVTTIANVTDCLKAGLSKSTDALSTSSGTYNLSTFTITSPAPLGSYTLTGSTINYTAPTNYYGDQIFTYSVSDVYGESFVGTVTFSVVNPGTSASLTVCNDGLYNLFSLLGTGVDPGGVWVNTLGGGPVPVTPTADINLTGLTGTFEYEYTVTVGACAIKSIVTIVKTVNIALSGDECASPIFFTSPITTDYANNKTFNSLGNCPTSSNATLSTQAYPATWSTSTSDVWYLVNLTAISTPANDIKITISSNNATFTNKAEDIEFAFYNTCGGAALTTTNTFSRNSSSSYIVYAAGTSLSTLLFRIGNNKKGQTSLVLTIEEV